MMSTKAKKWIKAAGIRAIRTVAQTAVATIGVSAVIQDVNWTMLGSASLLAGIFICVNEYCELAGSGGLN